MGTKLRTLDVVALAALACYGASVLPFIPREVSSVTGSVLCFILTGVAAAVAVLPRHASALAWFTAVTACALGAGIVGGLILNLLPSGLVRFNWVTYAFATTLLAYGIARARGAGSPVHWKRPEFPTPTWATGAKVLASVLIVVAAIFVSVNSTNAYEKHFTELWLVPDSPARSPIGATLAVVGIKSHESSTEDFTVVVDTGKKSMTSRVTLDPNEVWTQTVPVEGAKASASVYRGSVTSRPYRRVWIVAE
jgi:hypothetical protein